MKYIFILIFFVLSLQNTYASHVAGGELTYQCMGLDSFKFTYVFYNDCYSPIANNVVGMWIYNLPGFGDQILLSMTSNSPIEIVSNCPGVTTTCHGGTSPGIQKYIYEGYYVFPDTSSHWEFVISESTRSCATTTFQTPCANNLYIHATLNNTNLSCCNSPVLKSRQ